MTGPRASSLGGPDSSAPVRPLEAWTLAPRAVDLFDFDLVQRDGDLELLTEDERARASRLIIPAKRAQFIAGRATLRRLLGARAGIDPATVRFAYGEHGKPELEGATGASPRFNLSHSHTRGLLAVAPADIGTVGVDVEHRRPGRAFEAIAERFFSPPELEQLLAAPPADRPAMFYRAWAQKEAYLKAWGTGLTFSSQRFTVTMGRDRAPGVLDTQMPGDAPTRWSLRDVEVSEPGGPGYAAALCLPRGAVEVRCFSARVR